MKRVFVWIVKAILPVLLYGCGKVKQTESTVPVTITADVVLAALKTSAMAPAEKGRHQVVGISAGFDPRSVEETRRVLAFFREAKLSCLPVVLDPTSEQAAEANQLSGNAEVFRAAGLRALPTWLVLNSQGKLVAKFEGYLEQDTLLQAVR
jgi:dihydrodipicolinate synthase/N-acetylneuraminate lyase